MRYQAEDTHRLGLAYAMHTVHRLKVDLRVEIGVVQHHSVGRCQGDAKTAGPRRAQENRELGARRVEGLNIDGALDAVRRPIEPCVQSVALLEKLLDDVKHRGPPREQDNPVTGRQ
eukprot:scaffold187598_cov30-Tisochrysis_lutea.AAC.1